MCSHFGFLGKLEIVNLDLAEGVHPPFSGSCKKRGLWTVSGWGESTWG